MDQTIWLEERRRKTTRMGGWVIAAIVLFYAAVCTPVYLWSSSDVVIADTPFPAIWDAVQWIVQYLFYWVAFAYAIYLAARYSLKRCKAYLICYAVCVAARYIITLGISYAMLAGGVGWDSLGLDLLYMLIDIGLDCCQMAFVVLMIYLLMERRHGSDPNRQILLPKLFDFSNPILRCALLAVSMPAALKLLGRIGYDIFYGSAQNLYDLLFIIFAYVMDVVSILIGYMVVFLIISRLNLRDEEAKQHVMEQIPGGDL